MNFEHVFILTYGRSGSTLLQGVLNSIPGACIRGENGGALVGLWRAFEAAENARVQFGQWSGTPANPWFGAADIDLESFGKSLAVAFVKNVLYPPIDAKVVGFKEIRYSDFPDEIGAFVDFCRRFFPKTAFIVNTRNLADTLASMERTGMDVTADQLGDTDAALKALTGSDVFHVRYDDYATDSAALRGLFEFLGAEFDENHVRAVVDVEHSTFNAPQVERTVWGAINVLTPPPGVTWPGIE